MSIKIPDIDTLSQLSTSQTDQLVALRIFPWLSRVLL
ncbi:hypothetical protein [Proteus phage RP7]|nr:hypothetical protein [Proteus phage RP7]